MKTLDIKLLNNNVRAIAQYDLDNKKVFGSAYLVLDKNETLFCECYGAASMDRKKPISERTIYRIASMTKPVTAIATLILVERGLISLDDGVDKYFPELSNLEITALKDGGLVSCGRASRAPTIAECLSHSSGFVSDAGGKMPLATADDKASIENTIKFCAKVGLDFEPGTKAQYSSTAALDVVAGTIQKVSGTDYRTFLKNEIFTPLGMYDTDFVPTEEQWSRFMEVHIMVDGKPAVRKMWDGCVFADYPATRPVAGAGLFSTVTDYALFAKMLLNKGRAGDKRIISEETFSELTKYRISRDSVNYWGLAVRVVQKDHDLPIGAYGWSGAYGSHFWIDPENEIAAVFMKNSCFDGGAGTESGNNFEKAVHDAFV